MNAATDQPRLPVVGPQHGETAENSIRRRDVLRNVPLAMGPENFVGISNFGNQCFFIAVLQGLLHHSRIARFCRYHHIGPRNAQPNFDRLNQHIRIDASTQRLNCAYCQLYELLVRYWTRHFDSPEERRKEVNSRVQKLLERFRMIAMAEGAMELSDVGQQDAAAAYRLIVEWLRRDPDCDSHAPSELATNALFYLQTRKETTCQQCKHTVALAEEAPMLALTFPAVNHHQPRSHRMGEFVRRNLQGNVTKRCEKCPPHRRIDPAGLGDKRDGEPHGYHTTILHYPELLCMSLMLFQEGGNAGKIADTVEIPEEIDLSAGSSHRPRPPKRTFAYRLCAIIKHIGTSQHSGHYICFALKPGTGSEPNSGEWWECNDDECKPATFQKAKDFNDSGTPYLLFYERIYPKDERLENDVVHEDETRFPSWWISKKPDFPPVAKGSPGKPTPQPVTIDLTDTPSDKSSGKDLSKKRTPPPVTKDPSEQSRDANSKSVQTSPSLLTSSKPQYGSQTTQTTPKRGTVDQAVQKNSPSTKAVGKPRVRKISDADYEPKDDEVEDEVVSDDEVADHKAGKTKKPSPKKVKDPSYRPPKDGDAPNEDEDSSDDDVNGAGQATLTAQADAPLTAQDGIPLTTQDDATPHHDGNQPTQKRKAKDSKSIPKLQRASRPIRTTRATSKITHKDASAPTMAKSKSKGANAKKVTKKPAAQPVSYSTTDYSKQTVVSLRKIMKDRKLVVERADKKADLINKLETNDRENQAGESAHASNGRNASKTSAKEKSAGKKRTAAEVEAEVKEAPTGQDQRPKKKAKKSRSKASATATDDSTPVTGGGDANTDLQGQDGGNSNASPQDRSPAPLSEGDSRKRAASPNAEANNGQDEEEDASQPPRKRAKKN